jgi:chemotaxis protein methyltransferase CheR
VTDAECVRFLQWCLPRLGLRWSGYRRVRRTACKRVERRMRELGLAGPDAYRAFLERSPAEWARLDAMLRIPVSRLWRDRRVFEALASDLVPSLAARAQARGDAALRAWSAGCASGEEAYSLAMLWRIAVAPSFPGLRLDLLATDADPVMIARARRACFASSSLRELPVGWRDLALEPAGDLYRVRPAFREGIVFRVSDLRAEMPPGPFDLVLCRNVVITYLEPGRAGRLLARLRDRLVPGGLLVVGAHERPPDPAALGLEQVGRLPVWRRVDPPSVPRGRAAWRARARRPPAPSHR